MATTSLKQRSEEHELLDDLNCQGKEIDQNLRELEVINKWLGGDDVTINGIGTIIKEKKLQDKVITIADLGCGGGDLLKKIAIWARKKNIKVKLTGIDANDYIINYAKSNSADFPEIDYKSLNILSPEFEKLEFDIITSTLFTHHFNDIELVKIYQQLYCQANHGILTNDIHRHPIAYHSINILTNLLSKSFMVKNDAKLSVRRAFKLSELRTILQKAGLIDYRIRWMWAFRWQVIVLKNNDDE